MDDVQVLCDLEIDMAEARSTWQQAKSLFLADCLQSNSKQPHPIPDGKGSFLLMPTCLGMTEKRICRELSSLSAALLECSGMLQYVITCALFCSRVQFDNLICNCRSLAMAGLIARRTKRPRHCESGNGQGQHMFMPGNMQQQLMMMPGYPYMNPGMMANNPIMMSQ